MTTDDATKKIRELNDQFRRTLGGSGSGKKFMTAGVAALPIDDQAAILVRVVSFEDFTPDNDPYEEHDFGAFDHQGKKLFWKIDYYDAACKYGSNDPADPAQTTRVLTIMLASEY
jgi:type IV pilus biogenesis protein CpaD/CtpE